MKIREEAADSSIEISEKEFRRLSGFIHDRCGIRLPPAKKMMLQARLQRRLRSLSFKSYGEYCDYVLSPEGMEKELNRMIDLVTTNKTDFFREPGHFDYLVERALPTLLDPHIDVRKTVKVWSAGCSTGEEPYTLAMVLSDYAEANPGFTFRVLATDISTRVLQAAALGIYDSEKVDPVPPSMKKRYLLRSKDRSRDLVRVSPAIRILVKFRRLNFMDSDFELADQLDVIFCRNVIIYFDKPTQERLLKRFCHYLAPGGFLFLGHSETIFGMDLPLVQMAPTIYRKP